MEYAIAIGIIVMLLLGGWAMMRSAREPLSPTPEVIHGIETMMRITGKKRAIIRVWIKTGRLKARKVGGHYWCFKDDLMRCNVIHNRRHDDVVKMVVEGGVR